MLLRSVFLKTVRDLRWPVLWAGLGLGILGAYFMWIYESFTTALDFQEILDAFPPAIKALIGGAVIDISSPTGFLNMELFPLMLPLVLGGFAIALGSGATAAEESRGTLDVLLSEPIQRWRVVTEKVLAMVIATAAVALALFVGIELGCALGGISVAVDRVAGGLVVATLLALVFGGIALSLACWTGNRALAIGLTGAILVIAYFINALAPLVDSLDRIQGISPFYYYLDGDPLRNGVNWAHAGILAGAALVFYVLALVGFERRDLAA
jgi:ABC-2 type transport system permease protein